MPFRDFGSPQNIFSSRSGKISYGKFRNRKSATPKQFRTRIEPISAPKSGSISARNLANFGAAIKVHFGLKSAPACGPNRTKNWTGFGPISKPDFELVMGPILEQFRHPIWTLAGTERGPASAPEWSPESSLSCR